MESLAVIISSSGLAPSESGCKFFYLLESSVGYFPEESTVVENTSAVGIHITCTCFSSFSAVVANLCDIGINSSFC